LYGPEDGKTFEGVIGKNLSNPIPAWAEHGADRKVVPYTVATDMDSPNPDSGEEWYHTNTQLFGGLDEHNRRLAQAIQADGRVYLAPAAVDGRVCLRVCFVNFRTTDEQVDDVVAVIRELGDRLTM